MALAFSERTLRQYLRGNLCKDSSCESCADLRDKAWIFHFEPLWDRDIYQVWLEKDEFIEVSPIFLQKICWEAGDPALSPRTPDELLAKFQEQERHAALSHPLMNQWKVLSGLIYAPFREELKEDFLNIIQQALVEEFLKDPKEGAYELTPGMQCFLARIAHAWLWEVLSYRPRHQYLAKGRSYRKGI